MKFESLAKEIEKVIDSTIENFRDDIKSGYSVIENYDDVLDTLKRTIPQKVLIIMGQKVSQLLKEIDKMWDKAYDKQIEDSKVYSWYDGYKQACEDLEKKVKKAFVEVSEDD